MKTRHIALTLLAGTALLVTSCNIEREINIGEIGENDIAFRLAAAETRSAAMETDVETVKVATIKMGDGERVVMQETVESLNEGIVTRGTPAYTENVQKLYGSFNAVGKSGKTGGTDLPDASFSFDGSTYWSHSYGKNVWADAPYTFYMRMPASPAGVTSAYTYNTDGSIEFDYTSPESAAGQQDILFTSTTMEDEDDNGKDVVFYHALTGIKFQNFFTNKESDERTVAKTIIKEVTMTGLKNTGHCKVQSNGTVTWTQVDGKQSFTITAGTAPKDTTNYVGGQYNLSEKLNKGAAARNINNEDGTLTLWVVPQTFTDSTVMITVKCDIELVGEDEDGEPTSRTSVSDTTITVSLGARNWTAGQLHTFTLRPVIVGVEIQDNMSDFVKSNVEVANTGNVWEYVRVNMVANWVGNVQTDSAVFDWADTTILMGYAKEDTDSLRMVDAWNDKDKKTHYGEFVKLTPRSYTVPAPADNVVNGWVRYDKYYYYTLPIGPDDTISEDLFESYTVGVSPEFWIPDQWGVRRKAANVHLVMDLMVQAIPAPVDVDGNVIDNTDGQGYIRAWVKALEKTSPSDLLDL